MRKISLLDLVCYNNNWTLEKDPVLTIRCADRNWRVSLSNIVNCDFLYYDYEVVYFRDDFVQLRNRRIDD